MKSILSNFLAVLTLSLLITACATTRLPMAAEQIDSVLSTMPADTRKARNAMAEQFLKKGEPTIVELYKRVVPAGEGDDATARFAINGIAKYASRPGAPKQRQTFENGTLTALPSLNSDESKAFAIEQLEVAGSEASITALATYLGHAHLAQPSITTLQTIGTPKARAALHAALDRPNNIPTNIALVKALGDLRHSPSTKKIIPFAISDDRALKFTALYALANIADPTSETILEAAVHTSEGYDQTEAKSLLALYHRRNAK